MRAAYPALEPVHEWRRFDFFGRPYEVSNLGHIRCAVSGRVLKQTVRKDGYRAVTLQLSRRGRRQTLLVHGLMAAVFLGPRPAGLLVRHLDGSRDGNWFGNLAYGTHQENSDDMRLHGTVSRGSGKAQSKLTERTVGAVRALRGIVPVRELAKWLSVSPSIISQAQLGQTWTHDIEVPTVEGALRAIFRSGRARFHAKEI